MRHPTKAFLFNALGAAGILLAGCNMVSVNPDAVGDGSSESSMTESISSIRETGNVTYSGVIQPSGISIYSEGSHRLVLPEGKFILLESESVDLNGYVGETVNVFGSIRPTVEAGGMIMRVDTVQLTGSSDASVSSPTSDSSAEMSSLSSESESTSSVSSVVSLSEQSSVSSSSVKSVASSSKPVSSASQSVSEESSSSVEQDAKREERIVSMSHQNLENAQWTQQYCTSHIGFCVPVHRNWWFKSFGATNTELWHVEINSEPLEMLGDGPIVIRLMTGTDTPADNTVTTQGSNVTFVKSWSLDRHFEIVADKRLEESVRYIGAHLTEFAQSL